MKQDKKKEIVVLTGGSGYLGEEMGTCLMENNYFVINVGRKEPKFCSNKESSIHYFADFYNSKLLEKILKKILKQYKKIDILINNSFDFSTNTGFNSDIGRLENINKDTFINGLHSGIYWTFQCSQIIGKEMLKSERGIIINIASLYSYLVPNSKMYEGTTIFNPVTYSVSKHGIMGLTKYLASFWGPYGIRVNALSPGTFPNTNKNDNKKSPNSVSNNKFINLLENKCALKRVGKPNDLNAALLFLCSEKSKLMHGENIVIDGGWSLL